MTVEPRGSRRRTPLARVTGSLLSWFVFTLCMTLLFQTSLAVMSLGGSCASGGAYSIAVQCPESVVIFAPLSIFGGLGAVAIAIFFSLGFGVSLVDVAWTVLFVSLGGAFLYSFLAFGDVTGLVVGIMFLAMGLFPLVILVRAGVREMVLGTINVRGEKFARDYGSSFRIIPRPHSQVEATVEPRAADWLLSLGLFAVAVGGGYAVSELLWAAASAS